MDMDPRKIVVFSGAGVSAESGLQTFRDADEGLWNNYAIEDVATAAAWQRNPGLVLEFYNQRRNDVEIAQPNAAHLAIAALEQKYDVHVITQNVDDLHERAGSRQIIHLHGEITKARGTNESALVSEIGYAPINLGDQCAHGSQLRPDIVWFGEEIKHYEEAKQYFPTASKVLVVGTSLSVYPASGLLKKSRFHAERIVVGFELHKRPFGFEFIKQSACNAVPRIVESWLKQAQ